MSDRERALMELHAHLEQARSTFGSVNPQFSYFQRLVNAAHSDDQLLSDLRQRVQRDGGFK